MKSSQSHHNERRFTKTNYTLGMIVLLFVLVSMLVGCSQEADTKTPAAQNQTQEVAPNDKEAVSEQTNQTTDTSEETEQSAVVEDRWPLVFTDGADHEIVLEQAAERVVVLHPMYLEYFLALDTVPVASGNAAEALATFETLQPYASADVMDLGSGREINLEKIAEADPDVIVTFVGHADSVYDDLRKIAPVVQINYTDTWDLATRICAQLIGKDERGEQLIEETWQLVTDTRNQLKALDDKSFALLRGGDKGTFRAQGSNNTFYYSDTHGFGLTMPEAYPEDGLTLSFEAMLEMDPDYLVFQHSIPTIEAFIEESSEMTTWQALTAVKEDQVLLYDNSLNSLSVLSVRLAAEKFLALVE